MPFLFQKFDQPGIFDQTGICSCCKQQFGYVVNNVYHKSKGPRFEHSVLETVPEIAEIANSVFTTEQSETDPLFDLYLDSGTCFLNVV